MRHCGAFFVLRNIVGLVRIDIEVVSRSLSRCSRCGRERLASDASNPCLKVPSCAGLRASGVRLESPAGVICVRTC
jgi:hypothetical protein